MRLRIAFPVAVLAAASAGSAQEAGAFGRWLTEDKGGVVEFYPCGAELCGRIVWQEDPLDSKGQPSVDDKNPDPALRGQRVCGLTIMRGFRRSSATEWADGTIYDPDSGKTWSAQLELRDPRTLRLRGYVGVPLFGASQVWTRETGTHPACSP